VSQSIDAITYPDGYDHADFDRALTCYIECALWSEHCLGTATHDECRGSYCDTSLASLGYGENNVSFGSRIGMAEDLCAFIEECLADWPGVFDGIAPGAIGDDFWLSRNGAGAGFWDSGLGDRGSYLHRKAKPYGEAILWVGEDNRVYYQS